MLAGPMILDDESTWPKELAQMLDEHASLLEQYEAEARRIDRLCEQDPVHRANPPENLHRRSREKFLYKVDEFLQDKTLVGYHCTRLHEEEIKSILEIGLLPLSKGTTENRISKLQERGELAESIAQKLRQHNWADGRVFEGNRSGIIWFVLTRSLLYSEDGYGISSFFRYWGGEAIYAPHEDDPYISSVLQQIGTPFIIEAVLTIDSVKTYGSMGEKFLCEFLHRRGV